MAGKGLPIEEVISLVGQFRDGVRRLGRASIMNGQKSKEEICQELIHQLWQQHPRGVVTFGPCSRKCGSGIHARGGGPCAICVEKDLAAIVGDEDARAYHGHIMELRRLESDFHDKLYEA